MEESAALARVPGSSRLPMVWAVAFALGVSLLVISSISVVIRTYTPVPRLDQWAEVLWLKNYYAGHASLADLWQQHNEHRILFPMLFLLTDWFWSRGRTSFCSVSMLLLQAGHALGLHSRGARLERVATGIRLTVIAILAALVFFGRQLEKLHLAFSDFVHSGVPMPARFRFTP